MHEVDDYGIDWSPLDHDDELFDKLGVESGDEAAELFDWVFPGESAGEELQEWIDSGAEDEDDDD